MEVGRGRRRKGTLLKKIKEDSPPFVSILPSDGSSPLAKTQTSRGEELGTPDRKTAVSTGPQAVLDTPLLLWDGKAFGKADKE